MTIITRPAYKKNFIFLLYTKKKRNFPAAGGPLTRARDPVNGQERPPVAVELTEVWSVLFIIFQAQSLIHDPSRQERATPEAQQANTTGQVASTEAAQRDHNPAVGLQTAPRSPSVSPNGQRPPPAAMGRGAVREAIPGRR